jgi:hypothetical protein
MLINVVANEVFVISESTILNYSQTYTFLTPTLIFCAAFLSIAWSGQK